MLTFTYTNTLLWIIMNEQDALTMDTSIFIKLAYKLTCKLTLAHCKK